MIILIIILIMIITIIVIVITVMIILVYFYRKRPLSGNRSPDVYSSFVFLRVPFLFSRPQYDAIGRYENLKTEGREALQWMGAGELANHFPPPARTAHTSPSTAREYLQRLPVAHRLGFYKTYLLDYLLFGYHIP